MQTSELVKTNAALQESLTTDNSDYYENLVVYVRVTALFRDENKSEELLLEVLQDILDAQNQGISAEHYFGKNPKEIADDIIKQLPFNLMDTVKIFLVSIGIYSIISVLPELIIPDKGFDIGRFIVSGIYWVVLVVFALWLLGISLYRFKSKLSKLGLGLLVSIGILLGITIRTLVSTPFKLNLSGNLGILIIISISVILLYMFHKVEDKKMWLHFIPILIISAIVGILIRLDSFSMVLNSKEGRFGIVITIGVVLSLQFLFAFLSRKRIK